MNDQPNPGQIEISPPKRGMKKTVHYTGHRWTDTELKVLMKKWAEGDALASIAESLNASTASVLKMVNKLRKNGIPLERRRKGHVAGRVNKLWTQGEVEYLVRRRREKATVDEIAVEIDRTWNSVNAMIQKLRNEHVPVAMLGNGVRRLWNADALKAVAMQDSDLHLIKQDQ